ncbi:MAG: hypothetical protein GY930_07175 [bacterium]|nr:hypothetical protein [bacterium]
MPQTGPCGPGTSPDFSAWSLWWGFNNKPYLNLKARIHSADTVTGSDDWILGAGTEDQTKGTLKPSQKQIRGFVVPALLKVLNEERGNDLITGALIALAKIGDFESDSGSSDFQKVISPFLKNSNQEISETAAIALGILASDASVPLLTQLMNDDVAARSLLGKTEVPFRTRAFAAYGLGLIGHATSDNELRKQIAASLVQVLGGSTFARRDLKTAAMISFGLTPLDPSAADYKSKTADMESAASSSREGQLMYLLSYYAEANSRKHSRTRHYRVRAHAPTAMAKLLSGNASGMDATRTLVIKKLLEGVGPNSRYNRDIQRSCVLALGQLVDARSGDPVHTLAHETLLRLSVTGEHQNKRFALISMAQIAARPAPAHLALPDRVGKRSSLRKALVSRLSEAKGDQSSWAGLAIGVHARALIAGDQSPLAMGALDALRMAARNSKNPSRAGAYMLGLGLCEDQDSAKMILGKLESFRVDETRGHCAIALGLMNYKQAIEPISRILAESEYRPDLLKQAAVALGLLGDKEMVGRLLEMLGNAKSLSSQAAVASALGTIGDKYSVYGLINMLHDKSKTQASRGFAAVALGIVCDKEMHPWNAKIGTNINYRADTRTLTNPESTGILDIL